MSSKVCTSILVATVIWCVGGAGTAAPVAEAAHAGARLFAVEPIVNADELPAPGKIPPAPSRRDRIDMAVCPGQVELSSVCIYAGQQALESVTVRISDLTAVERQAANQAGTFVSLPKVWKFRPDPDDKGVSAQWFKPDLDVSTWADIRTDVGAGWDSQGFEEQAIGYGWYRQRLLPTPDIAKARHRYLFFRAVDEEAHVYLNGVPVFERTAASTGLEIADLWNRPFAVNLDDVWQGKANASLVVRVHNGAAMGGIWKPVFLFGSDSLLTAEQMNTMVMADRTRPDHGPQNRIPSSRFDPYVVQWWYRIDRDVPAAETKPVYRGELLVRDTTLIQSDHKTKRNVFKYPEARMRDAETLQPKFLEPGQGAQYLIFARIPGSTPPGRYRGKIEAVNGEQVMAEIPFEVTVLPFRLAEPLLDYTIYYRGSPHPDLDIADIIEHGFKRLIWLPYIFSPDKVISYRRQFGITGPLFLVFWHSPLRSDDDTERIEAGKRAIAKFRSAGCDPIYLAVKDEPAGKDMPAVRKQIDMIHRFWGVKAFTALCRANSWENLKNHLDLPNLYCERFGGRKGIARWQNVGKPVYVYGLASFHPDGLKFRRYYGLRAWKQGAQGCAPYAYQHPHVKHGWDSSAETVSFTWPTADSRLSTVQWEGMRSAITDVRYVSTLVEWLGRTAGPLAGHTSRDAAERALARLDPEGDLATQRTKIIECILALTQAMGEVPE